MAFPSVAGTIAVTSDGTATTSRSVNVPAGTVSGETLMLLFRTTGSSGNTGLPAGEWTTMVDVALTDKVGIAWRKASGAEASTMTVTTVGSTKFASLCFRVSGAADPTVTPPQISTVATGNSNIPDPSTCTPTGGAKDYLWIWFGSWQGEQTSPPTGNPTNYASNIAGADTGAAGSTATNSRVAMATRQLNAASEDPGSWTISVADQWAAYTIAIHPAPPSLAIPFKNKAINYQHIVNR
jgi:hypothetical protein